MNFVSNLFSSPQPQPKQNTQSKIKQFACQFSKDTLKLKDNLIVQYQTAKKNYKTYSSQYFLTFNKAVLQPTLEEYQRLPQTITDFKLKYLLPQNLHLRIIGLGFSSVLIGMTSFKYNKKLFLMVRNGVIGYYGIGLMITPEIFLPKQNENDEQ